MDPSEAEDFYFIQQEDLAELAPLLSEQSYRNIQSEIIGLKKEAPSASGLGIDNFQYIPQTLDECRQQVRRLQERLNWSRRLCFLSEISEHDARRKIRILKKENQKLREENEALKNEVKRAYNQLHTALGLKKDKPKKAENPDKRALPKKKRGAPLGHMGKTRPIPNKVDTVDIIPPPDSCPHCGQSHILAGNDYTSKYVEDIPPVVRTVTERRYMQGICAECLRAVVAPEATTGPPVMVGHNLIALLSVMRQQMGVSYRKLARFSTETLQIPLSPSGVLDIMNRLSHKLEPVYKGIESSLRAQLVLHGDETGWRMDGKRWYLWCFCNSSIVYFHADPSRGSKVPKAILGDDYSGIMHADFYAAYNFLPKTQRCLVHFQRAINEELEITPHDKALQRLKHGIKNLIEKGKELKKLPDSPEKNTQVKELENTLQTLSQLKSSNSKTKAYIQRLIRHKKDFLHFVNHPEAQYHNNRAEQAIRPAVIFRKISFGNRTPQGAQNYAILTSVLETCRLKKNNLSDFIRSVWATPKDQLHFITRSLLDTS